MRLYDSCAIGWKFVERTERKFTQKIFLLGTIKRFISSIKSVTSRVFAVGSYFITIWLWVPTLIFIINTMINFNTNIMQMQKIMQIFGSKICIKLNQWKVVHLFGHLRMKTCKFGSSLENKIRWNKANYNDVTTQFLDGAICFLQS